MVVVEIATILEKVFGKVFIISAFMIVVITFCSFWVPS